VFYRFMQNNSGGAYLGPQVMFVEADSTEEAEALAQGAGVYFDGVAAEKDCDCCGDRWFRDPDGFATEAEALASLGPYHEPGSAPPEHQFVRRAAG